MRQISPEVARHSHTGKETYTLGGLLAFLAFLPAVFVVLTAPKLVAAYVLGGFSAVALRKLYLRLRTALDNRDQPDGRPASSSRGSCVQSR